MHASRAHHSFCFRLKGETPTHWPPVPRPEERSLRTCALALRRLELDDHIAVNWGGLLHLLLLCRPWFGHHVSGRQYQLPGRCAQRLVVCPSAAAAAAAALDLLQALDFKGRASSFRRQRRATDTSCEKL